MHILLSIAFPQLRPIFSTSTRGKTSGGGCWNLTLACLIEGSRPRQHFVTGANLRPNTINRLSLAVAETVQSGGFCQESRTDLSTEATYFSETLAHILTSLQEPRKSQSTELFSARTVHLDKFPHISPLLSAP